MYRVQSTYRIAAGALFVLLLAAAFVLDPGPAGAYEERTAVVIGSGGGGGTIVPTFEGDPTDTNDYSGGSDLTGGDGTFHDDVGTTYSTTTVTVPQPAPVLEPRIVFFGRWSAHLAFENYRGVTMPYFRFFRVARVRGE